MSSRIALGTAQFGFDYGVANETGQVGRNDAARLLSVASAAGINTLDTAISYGESEKRLGEIGVGGWRVISKLPAVPESTTDVSGWVSSSVQGALARLGISRLHALLLHHPQDLLSPRGPELYAALLEARENGLVTGIGVSVYDPAELDDLPGRYAVDLVQAPFNVLDRRLEASGWLRRLRAARVEVHTRSTFLQGLLLMEAELRPPQFDVWSDLWRVWDAWLAERSQSAVQACLGFVLGHQEIDRVVVGVDCVAQLEEVIRVVDSGCAAADYPPALESTDIDLINPALWRAE
jgi:aryl-alcohol dehydrogenase-like predicted oxidoreductase